MRLLVIVRVYILIEKINLKVFLSLHCAMLTQYFPASVTCSKKCEFSWYMNLQYILACLWDELHVIPF